MEYGPFFEELIEVTAAANHTDILVPALLCSGQLHCKIKSPLLNESTHAMILKFHSCKMTCESNVNFEELAQSTDKFNVVQLKAVTTVGR